RAWIRLRDADFKAVLRSWKDYADTTAPDVENSWLFAEIRTDMNLARSAFLCSHSLADRGWRVRTTGHSPCWKSTTFTFASPERTSSRACRCASALARS